MLLKSNASVPNFQSDGLTITATEPWFKVKVQLVQSYLQAFIINAFPKADELIFVDLFSGSGLYSIGHQKEVFAGSCLTALSGDLPFHRWIFCESNPEQAAALDTRIRRFFPNRNADVFNIPEEDFFQTLNNTIPGSKAGHRVAVFCLIDPFSLEISQATIDKLASAGYSLLIPFAFPLNDRLTCRYYCVEQAEIVKKFIGAGNYQKLIELENNAHFYRKLVQLSQANLLVKGLNSALSSHKLNSKLMTLQSYTVGFFSRQFSAQAIQRDVNVNEHLQFELFSA